ncbi:UTRA domain-containing protein [Sphaerisporangium perillae]|uniref:UTRA domain-containing protein n=1 Tax=Sphaerisporangium perillae TaxID=2935860 RepID=UPI00200CCA01|nr:UTRA domain-containing protein [Sphaerisporangium perillae]
MGTLGEWIGSSTSYLSPRAPGQRDAWSEELIETGRSGSQHLREVAEIAPPAQVAQALGMEAGGTVVVRRRMMLVDERPVELTDSYYPATVAAGTPLAEAKKIPGGAPTLLAEIGYSPDEVYEDISIRAPTREEADLLHVQDESLVVVLFRVVMAAGRIPFEASVMTMLPEGRHFRYRFKAR